MKSGIGLTAFVVHIAGGPNAKGGGGSPIHCLVLAALCGPSLVDLIEDSYETFGIVTDNDLVRLKALQHSG